MGNSENTESKRSKKLAKIHLKDRKITWGAKKSKKSMKKIETQAWGIQTNQKYQQKADKKNQKKIKVGIPARSRPPPVPPCRPAPSPI